MLVELYRFCHDSQLFVGGTSRQTWIDLCQKAHTDPHELTNKHLDKLLKLILGASAVDAKVRGHQLWTELDFHLTRFPVRLCGC